MTETIQNIIIPNTIDELLRSFITPDTGDGFLDHFKKDDSENYRLTLLHKNDNATYYFLSENMQEINPEIKMDLGMSIAISKKKLKLQAHYDAVFHKRDIDNGRYFLLEEDNPIMKHRERVIPFCYDRKLPSTIVSKNLKEGLLDYITLQSDHYIKAMERIGERGLIKAIFETKFSNEWKTREADLREIRGSLKEDITSLFDGEQSPSLFIQPFEYLLGDRKKEIMFIRAPYLKYLLIGIPLLALCPYSIIDRLERDLSFPYRKKFENNKEEAKSMLSDFAIGHPKAIKGTRNIFESFKHSANICMYAALAGPTALAYNYAWPIISYPMILVAGASGATMMANLIKSKGKDSSGVISTVIDRAFFKRLE